MSKTDEISPVIIGFSGHRNIDYSEYCNIKKNIRSSFQKIIGNKDYQNFVVLLGEARGADSIAFEVCQELNLETVLLQTKGKRTMNYVELAEKIVAEAKYLVVAWDGIYNNKKGGTSDIVRRFKQQHGDKLIKIVNVERKSQQSNQQKSPKTNFLVGFSICFFFYLIDYISIFGWGSQIDSLTNILVKSCAISWHVILTGLYFYFVWVLSKKANHFKRIYQEYLVPLALIGYTLFVGTIGFMSLEGGGFEFGDSLFGAANFLTLNTSVFTSFLNEVQLQTINIYLVNARIVGGLFLVYAFFLTLGFALGYENTNRIRFWWYRIFDSIFKNSFIVVIGSGFKSLNLAYDLVSDGFRVVYLDGEPNSEVAQASREKGMYYLKGDSTSRKGLKKTYFNLAKKVFILNESEEVNFRTVQELVEISEEDLDYTSQSVWYASISDLRKINLLLIIMQNLPKYQLRCFQIEKNVARNIVLRHDIESLTDPTIVTHCAIIFGFSKVAKAVIMQYLNIGHFTKGKHMIIKVYYLKQEKEKVELFKQKYQFLFESQNETVPNHDLNDVAEYTFFNDGRPKICFEQLPLEESGLTNTRFNLYQYFEKSNIAISIYSCLETGVNSATFLSRILPRIVYINKCRYIKIYCHYNYLDSKEEAMIEARLHKLSNCLIPVKCFGNDLISCRYREIESLERDQLAKYIAHLYNELYSKKYEEEDYHLKSKKERLKKDYQKVSKTFLFWKDEDIENTWRDLAESDKESNRHAADHAYIKLGLFGKTISEKNTDPKTFWDQSNVEALAQTEHVRWNAEKLLVGWLPYSNYNKWKEDKELLKRQNLHYFLKKFEDLPEDEKDKDHTQIKSLPYFINKINEKLIF